MNTNSSTNSRPAFTLLVLPRAIKVDKKVSQLLTGAAASTMGYEYGMIKILPFRTHLTFDKLSGFLFCATPIIFPDEDQSVLSLLVGIGMHELAASQLSSIRLGKSD